MSTATTSTVFGLRHKVTGELVGVYQDETDGNGFSNADRYTLVLGGSYPLFEVDSPEKASLVLATNTPWYNSRPYAPMWGSVDVTELEVVEIVRTMAVTPVATTLPVRFPEPVETMGKFRSIVERYLGHPIPDNVYDSVFHMHIVHFPEGETLESLQAKCIGRPLFIGETSTYVQTGLGIFKLPEEYEDLLGGKPGCGLVAIHFER
jgi:hypothetical protein